MQTRTFALLMTACAVLALALSLASSAGAQDIVQKEELTQKLTVVYPDDGVVLQGKGDDEIFYKGTIYVKIYPTSPRLKKKLGEGAVFTNELEMKSWHNYYTATLPLGEYEVHFSMKDDDNFRTCIVRNVLLTADGETTVKAELSGTANTLIIGGTMTAQQMEDSIQNLQQQVVALQAQVDALKVKTAALAPIPAK